MSPTAADPLVGVVVDMEAQMASDARATLAAQLAAAAADGDLETVQALSDALQTLLEQQGDLVTAPVETITELTADEITVLEAAQADAFVHVKAQKAAEVQAALDATNGWVMEAFENGAQLTDAQKSYRDSLRALFPEIDAATDAAGLDAIEIPAPPA